MSTKQSISSWISWQCIDAGVKLWTEPSRESSYVGRLTKLVRTSRRCVKTRRTTSVVIASSSFQLHFHEFCLIPASSQGNFTSIYLKKSSKFFENEESWSNLKSAFEKIWDRKKSKFSDLNFFHFYTIFNENFWKISIFFRSQKFSNIDFKLLQLFSFSK